MCKNVWMMNNVALIIQKFGGLSKMAEALGHEYPTKVQGWRDRNSIPSRHIPLIIEAATARGIALTLSDFFDLSSSAAE